MITHEEAMARIESQCRKEQAREASRKERFLAIQKQLQREMKKVQEKSDNGKSRQGDA
jgi:hypothetical protein